MSGRCAPRDRSRAAGAERGGVDAPLLARLLAVAAALRVVALYVYGATRFRSPSPTRRATREIAREMLVRGDWVTPHLNYVKYFEKPPLVYWATAAAFARLGPSEFAARLPSLLSAASPRSR